jgi:ABC-2 type transport system permease protein
MMLSSTIRPVKAIFIRNLMNFTRDKTRLIFTLAMSVFFLFVFSFVMKSAAGGIHQPMNYLISGIIIMTVFQSALNNSMNIIEDISGGFMKEIIVAPIARWQISIGQIFSSAVIALLQGLITVILGLLMGLRLDFIDLVEMFGVMLLVGVTFSSIGLYLASLAKSSTTFQIMVSVLVMPLTFLSGAYIPTTVLPKFLYPVIYANPLTYTTSLFRYITLKMSGMPVAALIKAGVAFNIGGFTLLPEFGLIMIAITGSAFFGLCVHRFNQADFSNVKAVHGHHH